MVFLWTWILHLWWWLTGSLSIFDFFNRHHFFFSHKFCTIEFWVGFWWRWLCGVYGSSSLSPLQPPSLPWLLFSRSTVWYRISFFFREEHLIHRLSLISISIFSAVIFFSVWVEAFATLAWCFLVTWGWVRVVGFFSWRFLTHLQCTRFFWIIHRSPDVLPQRIPKDWRDLWEFLLDLGGWRLLRMRSIA